MDIILSSLTLLGALALLMVAADQFTSKSESLGRAVGIPQFIVGVSIVALGTSFPELMTSLLATLDGVSSLVAANVLGSNIANILLVGGFTAVVAHLIMVEKSLISLDLPILGAITALLIVTIYDGTFTAIEGIIMLLSYVTYIYYNWSEHRKSVIETFEDRIAKNKEKKEVNWASSIGIILVSGFGIYLGARWSVSSILKLSSALNLLPSVITVSAVAIGTSLPELVVSIQAARKKNFDMVLGNIIGSNILNSTLVMAIPAFITPLEVSSDVITIAIPFLIISTILFAFSGIERKIFSFEGALYGLLYIVFIGQLYSFI